MDTKIGVLAIIIDDADAVERVNALLHVYRENIIGRLGIPVKDRGISVISIAMDATSEIINGLSGKLGMIKGVTVKAVHTK
mgnify:CR=1 FL=1